MKNMYIIIIVAGVLVFALLLYLILRKNVVYKINYEYVGTIELDNLSFKEYNLFYEFGGLNRVFMNDFNYDVKKDSLIQSLNFDEYDYIITYQKEALRVEYDKNYSNKYDHCGYIKDLKPIKVTYSDVDYKHKLFVYKVFEKNKYRHLCP